MFKLFSRIAWILSILSGYLISIIILFTIFGYTDSESLFFMIIPGVLVGMMFKGLLLSSEFIESRLEYFAQAMMKKEIEEKIEHKPVVSLKTDTDTLEVIEDSPINVPLQENLVVQKVEPVKVELPIEEESEPSKLGLFIKQFFSENLLAKIGAILVFLGVVFLMSLIWNNIGPIIKIIIGFIIGFGCYIIGIFLDKKGIEAESRILMGAGILINFLVILSGRYLIGDPIHTSISNYTGILSISATFILLVLNTLFGVITGLKYKSKTLLIFSFIFAYINPFLVGASSTTPYTLIGYSSIVSLGSIYLGYVKKDMLFIIGAFILGNILYLSAPATTDIHLMTKCIMSALLGITTLYATYRTDKDSMVGVLIGNYVFMILFFLSGQVLEFGIQNLSYITTLVSLGVFFGIGIQLIRKNIISSILPFFVISLCFILYMILSGNTQFIGIILPLTALIFIGSFSSIQKQITTTTSYALFTIFGCFLLFTHMYIGFGENNLGLIATIGSIISTFIFIIPTYYLSKNTALEYLFPLGTVGGIIQLLPLLSSNTGLQTLELISIAAIIIFILLNLITGVRNILTLKNKDTLTSLIIGSILGALFVGYELFLYGQAYFPGTSLGIAFIGLMLLYFGVAIKIYLTVGLETAKSDSTYNLAIITYLLIAISFFSLAIAIIFSGKPEIISTIWLFEASILFYFFGKTQNYTIFGAAITIFAIGIFKLFDLADSVSSREFIFLIPLALIFGSFVINLKLLKNKLAIETSVLHDIIHVLGILTLSYMLLVIIPSTGLGWSILGIAAFLTVLGSVYTLFGSSFLKYFYITSLSLFSLYHIGDAFSIFDRVDLEQKGYLRSLQYVATLMLAGSAYIWNRFNSDPMLKNTYNSVFALYILLIVSIYVQDIFNTTFAVTIFWGIISSILLFYGIGVNAIKYRTIGLYLLGLVLTKIFLYDIWYGIDDAITRVIALIVIGILLIIISIRYTAKYGNNLKGEFNLSNLSTYSEKQKQAINTIIDAVEINDIESISFDVMGGRKFSTKSKNIIKISAYVAEKYNKKDFESGELAEVYNYLKSNYQSNLAQRDYDKVTDILRSFVDQGGSMEFHRK